MGWAEMCCNFFGLEDEEQWGHSCRAAGDVHGAEKYTEPRSKRILEVQWCSSSEKYSCAGR